MAVADERTRAAAKSALPGLQATGGTAIGQWPRLAHQVFQSCPATQRHAILLAAGKNQHEEPAELATAISLCEGTFRCDCREIGTDWEVSELRKISSALLGSLDIMPGRSTSMPTSQCWCAARWASTSPMCCSGYGHRRVG
jgi:hypothetical protein